VVLATTSYQDMPIRGYKEPEPGDSRPVEYTAILDHGNTDIVLALPPHVSPQLGSEAPFHRKGIGRVALNDGDARPEITSHMCLGSHFGLDSGCCFG
jgi:hypothetical protein